MDLFSWLLQFPRRRKQQEERQKPKYHWADCDALPPEGGMKIPPEASCGCVQTYSPFYSPMFVSGTFYPGMLMSGALQSGAIASYKNRMGW